MNRVKAAEDINLAFRVSGTIDRFYAQEGARVKKGDLLARLEPTDYQVQLEATEAEYHQVKADAERIMALYRDSSTTASNYDKAVYGLQQISAKYRHHQDQLAYTQLYAPFDGSVQKHLFDAHETVEPACRSSVSWEAARPRWKSVCLQRSMCAATASGVTTAPSTSIPDAPIP